MKTEPEFDPKSTSGVERKQFIVIKSIVVNKKGEYLFVKRHKEDHKEVNNKWEFPGGKVEFGESTDQTAVRETKEETGYDIEIVSLLPEILNFKGTRLGRESQIILICYFCKLKGGKASLNDSSVSEIKWFKENEIPEDGDCLPGTIDFFKIYLSSKNKEHA